MSEEKDSGTVGFKVFSDYLSLSPGCFFNTVPLILAGTPFVLVGLLRFFIASWSASPFSDQIQPNKKI